MKKKQGFTLLGLIMVIVIGAIAIPPMMMGVSQWLEAGLESQQMAQAVQLAADMMDEILSKRFADEDEGPSSFGIELGEVARTDFDDVDDYDNWVAEPPEDMEGNPLAGYESFRRSVAVHSVNGNNLTITAPADPGKTDYKIITVLITWSGQSISLQSLKVRGHYDHTWWGGWDD